MTEQMRNILASFFILRGRDTLRIDFLQFISGRNDLRVESIYFDLFWNVFIAAKFIFL